MKAWPEQKPGVPTLDLLESDHPTSLFHVRRYPSTSARWTKRLTCRRVGHKWSGSRSVVVRYGGAAQLWCYRLSCERCGKRTEHLDAA